MWWEGKLYNNATISFFVFFNFAWQKKKRVPSTGVFPVAIFTTFIFYINVCNDCNNYRRMLWSSRRNFLFCFYPHWITFLHTIIKTKLYIEKQVPHVLFFPFSRGGTCVCPLFSFLSIYCFGWQHTRGLRGYEGQLCVRHDFVSKWISKPFWVLRFLRMWLVSVCVCVCG